MLTAALQIAAYFARLSNQLDTEKAVLNEIAILQGARVRDATTARDDVLAGRVPDDPNDPHRRD